MTDDDDFDRLLKKVAHVPAQEPPSTIKPPKFDDTPSQKTPADDVRKGRPSVAAAEAAVAAAEAAAAAEKALSKVTSKGTPPGDRSSRRGWSGRLVAGRYHIGRQLGAGGMGAVFEASDEVLKRSVAVKVVSEARATPDTIARFRLEAQAAAALSDPSIVTVHDFGVEDDVPFIVMERVHGTPLHALIARDRSDDR
jgi:hypothetical protein